MNTNAEVRMSVLMDMLTTNAWDGDEPVSYQIVLPKLVGAFERDDQPFYDLVYWIETHLGRHDEYRTIHNIGFEYVLRPEYCALWDHNTNMAGFAFVSDNLATLFKTFHA